MEKINLSLKNVIVIPVPKAIRAVKGEYLLIQADGTLSVVPGNVYRAMSCLQKHSHQAKQPVQTKYTRLQTNQHTRLRPLVLECLQKNGPLLTSELALKVDVPWRCRVTDKRAYLVKLCKTMEKNGLLEHVQVEAPSVDGTMRRQSLWAGKGKCGSALEDKAKKDYALIKNGKWQRGVSL